jgi:hypothetical protein
MNLDIIINKFNFKYYKGLKHHLDKTQIKAEWLNKHISELSTNINSEKLSETTTQVQIEKKNINLSETENHKHIFSDEDLYKKPWIKLNSIHKILKIKQFVNDLKFDSEKDRINLREELIELVKNKILTKKEKIKYDEINGKIIALTNLQYKNGKYFYLIE